jgi:hypothetical protein
MRLKLLTAALVAALFFPAAQAAPIEAQGSAPLDAGVTAAREQAIQDALRQAALSAGARVSSAQYMNSGQVSESSTLSAAPLAGQVQVLDEQEKDGLYQVRIRIDPELQPAAKPSASRCATAGGRSLRRRVVAAHFFVDEPAEAGDLENLGWRLPHELALRLQQAHDDVLTARDAGNVAVLPDRFLSDPALGAEHVRKLAQAEDVQFVVAGRIFSTAVIDRGVRGEMFGSAASGKQGLFYNGPFSALTGGALVYRPTARQFDIELWIYDGVTGTLLQTKRLSAVGHGDVQPDRPIPFASAGFWDTDYGKAIDGVLNDATRQVVDTIRCIPFSTRVVRVGDGGLVYLDAGSMDGLQVGDKLLVYRPRLIDALQAEPSGRILGVPETLLGDVSVIQVQPNLAVAVAQGTRSALRGGDIVRFMPAR